VIGSGISWAIMQICSLTLHITTPASHRSVFFTAMQYSAKRGLAIACRLSVRLSVMLVDYDHKVENLGN